MNNIRNKVILIGNIGGDPEIKILDSGKKKASFSLATNESYVNGLGERVENTHWHRVVFWNKWANIIEEYVTKGCKLAVEGSIAYRSWEDEAGVKHYRTEIKGREMMILSRPSAATGDGPQPAAAPG